MRYFLAQREESGKEIEYDFPNDRFYIYINSKLSEYNILYCFVKDLDAAECWKILIFHNNTIYLTLS